MAVQPGAAFQVAPTPYIADHDTTPQQVVRMDPTNILIRTLQNKRAKEEAKRKQAKAAGAHSSSHSLLPGRCFCMHSQLAVQTDPC